MKHHSSTYSNSCHTFLLDFSFDFDRFEKDISLVWRITNVKDASISFHCLFNSFYHKKNFFLKFKLKIERLQSSHFHLMRKTYKNAHICRKNQFSLHFFMEIGEWGVGNINRIVFCLFGIWNVQFLKWKRKACISKQMAWCDYWPYWKHLKMKNFIGFHWKSIEIYIIMTVSCIIWNDILPFRIKKYKIEKLSIAAYGTIGWLKYLSSIYKKLT